MILVLSQLYLTVTVASLANEWVVEKTSKERKLLFGPQSDSAMCDVSEQLTRIELSAKSAVSAASTAPMAVVSNLVDYLYLSPDNLSNIERISFPVPQDWECQARVTNTAFPCPNGVPSECRYYYRSNISDSCIANYCTPWFSKPADQDYPSYGSEGYCCRFFEHLADKSNTSASSCDSANTTLNNGFWSGYSHWADEYHSDMEQNVTENAMVPHLINFKINRFEVGPGLLTLNSADGDIVAIFADGGQAFFKPLGHAKGLEIFIDETIPVEMPTPVNVEVGRRRLDTELIAGARRTWANYDVARFTGSCHPDHGCPRKQLKQPSEAGENTVAERDVQGRHGKALRHRELRGRELRRGSDPMMSQGSFLMSNNGPGNSR